MFTYTENRKLIGYAYVCGDILHYGHVLHLQNCRALCDKLIVGVLTDEAIMEKKQKPIIGLRDRMEMVELLPYVDIVVPQNDYSPIYNICDIGVDVLFESTSHSKEDLKETFDIAKKKGIKVRVMPYYPNNSSTEIKEKIKSEWKK